MIFVTVGTHEQQFDRLIKKIDCLKRDEKIKDIVVIQKGYSQYTPKYCEYQDFFDHDSIVNYVKKARIIITHGGPSSFISVLQQNKVPIVVPRMKKYEEHINNHQMDFVKKVEKRKKNIIVVTDINQLGTTIDNYAAIVSKLDNRLNSNNLRFNKKLQNIVNEIL